MSDSDILMDAKTGQPIYMQNQFGFYPVERKVDGKSVIDGEAQKSIMTFMIMWAKNIQHQGFIEEAKKMREISKDETI